MLACRIGEVRDALAALRTDLGGLRRAKGAHHLAFRHFEADAFRSDRGTGGVGRRRSGAPALTIDEFGRTHRSLRRYGARIGTDAGWKECRFVGQVEAARIGERVEKARAARDAHGHGRQYHAAPDAALKRPKAADPPCSRHTPFPKPAPPISPTI